ncbi:MAG: non-hydrolyzing UDP-N-acetylglucosamine 2-epimerase [Marinilabiliaceae bacterium]
MQKIILVAGARPNFVKIAPIWRAFSTHAGIQVVLVHTGQHFDENMDRVFFDELGLPRPDYHLNACGNSHAKQTADIMTRFDEVLDQEGPDDVVVVGDVNSTLACALVAAKRNIRVSHVEAGLRSFDRSMPEEINRVLTDAIADLLFVSEPSGMQNLEHENVPAEKIFMVGNVMIDSLQYARDRIESSAILKRYNLSQKNFVLVTIHRPSNVDRPERLDAVMNWLGSLSQKIRVVFPMHPRTRERLQERETPLLGSNSPYPGLNIIPPQGYIDFQKLVKSAQFVITDSGGLQEETTWLGVPCLTLRNNTERPVTAEKGTNRIVGSDLGKAGKVVDEILSGKAAKGEKPYLWDGKTATRVVQIISGDSFNKKK